MNFITSDLLNHAGALAVLSVVMLAVITDKLVWHTRLKSAEARADRWEKIAIEALSVSVATGVRTAEVAVGVVSSLPDPHKMRDTEKATD